MKASIISKHTHTPVKRYGEQTEKANDKLKMDPVVDEVRQQHQYTRSGRPEAADHCSSESSMFHREQLTSHHETRQTNTLTTNHDGVMVSFLDVTCKIVRVVVINQFQISS